MTDTTIAAMRTLGHQLESETWDAYRAHPRHKVLQDLRAAASAAYVNLGWMGLAPGEHPDAAVNAAWCLGKVHGLANDLNRTAAYREQTERWVRISTEIFNLLRPARPAAAPQEQAEKETPMTTVTAADVRELLTSRASDPILVEWLDEDEAVIGPIEVVSAALFDSIAWSDRDRAYRVLARAEDLRQMGDWDVNNPTDEDCEAFAQLINEESR